jgi:DNA-binding MarR family transcriptional regulator
MTRRQTARKPDLATEAPKLDFGDFLPYLINRVGFALVHNFTRDALAPTGLSIAMWRVLAVLPGHGEQRQIDLAEMTSIDSSTLSRLVTRLVELGLVTRRRSTSSSREVVVDLTAKGLELVGRLIPIAQELERTAIAGVSPKDLAIVQRSLRRMYDNMAKSR